MRQFLEPRRNIFTAGENIEFILETGSGDPPPGKAVVRSNIVLALAVKGAVLLGSALGIFGAWQMPLAIFADVGVAVLAILNAMRTLYTK